MLSLASRTCECWALGLTFLHANVRVRRAAWSARSQAGDSIPVTAMSYSPQAVFHMQSVKCLKCQEQTRAVLPCQHAVLCELCAEGSECPVCQPSRAHALQS